MDTNETACKVSFFSLFERIISVITFETLTIIKNLWVPPLSKVQLLRDIRNHCQLFEAFQYQLSFKQLQKL